MAMNRQAASGFAVRDDAKMVPSIPGNTKYDKYYSMVRIGKKKAGRELDGKVWDQYPKEF